ncbi:olfactory receptor 10AG1-like [Hyla sarda]|uniref:olfactory receptor 10AG1-like n=1 Tax=Hyla sarda TaxID=327740 RepID=UPI0024C3E141|nr:olfactory receptor 10AG1-like [Hyla sarda]
METKTPPILRTFGIFNFMDIENQTIFTDLVLLGFTDNTKINYLLFFIFFIIYIVTIFGNILIISIIPFNLHLNTPMYFFLTNLSFIDLCNISCAVPKLLMDLFSTQKTISLIACSAQIVLLLWIGANECLLLAVMAIDRYVAICHPLHYPMVMKWSVCRGLAIFVCVFSFTFVFLPSFTMPVTLCHGNKVNHFMCEALSVMRLACGDVHDNEIVAFFFSFISLFFPFVIILVSYSCILSSVLKMSSAGRSKAFSTCTSHIMVVALYFGTGMVTYLGPSTDASSNQEKYVSVFYVIVSPMLNPFIYSLKNRDVRETIAKMLSYKKNRG